ncbi:STAS domain-containing protein [Mycobacterium xenopi]|nr:STAS domain-containing protein [Mycobacterium xenopi]MDA3638604.1 STAS domain-containing protein [Mycobacterium xenopi]MDA3656693.1 STAS domain-containing protein [Mycobacterium xenopi]MDA3664430.1 STAS domain-containing protein [Mycobacterium xenopi]
MSVVRTAGFAGAALGVDTAFPSQPWESRTARFTAHWGPSAVAVVAHGELDAANASQLADYVQQCAAFSKLVILDLRGVEFFGTAGFSTLHTINVRCARADVQWAVVPSRAVSRVLRICDPEHALPIADSADVMLVDQREPRRLLQLVSQSR